jgi:hypothetical protein
MRVQLWNWAWREERRSEQQVQSTPSAPAEHSHFFILHDPADDIPSERRRFLRDSEACTVKNPCPERQG